MDQQKCRGCGERKPLQQFVKQATLVSGYQTICKACRKVRRQASYRAARINAPRHWFAPRRGRWDSLDLETILVVATALGRSPSLRDFNAVMGDGAAQAIARRVVGWTSAIALVGLTPAWKPSHAKRPPKTLSCAKRFQVFARDQFRCVYCGDTPDHGARLTIDHVIPVSAGGADELHNLRTACHTCNSGKGATLLELERAAHPLRVSLPGHQGRVETHILTGPAALGSAEPGCHPVKGEEEST